MLWKIVESMLGSDWCWDSLVIPWNTADVYVYGEGISREVLLEDVEPCIVVGYGTGGCGEVYTVRDKPLVVLATFQSR